MIRSRTGRYAKAPIDATKVVRNIMLAGIVISLTFLAGHHIGFNFKVNASSETEPEFHSPIPETLTVITPSVTPAPSATPTPSVIPVVQQQEPELMAGSDWSEEEIIAYIKTKDWNTEDAEKISRCECIHFTDFIGDESLTFIDPVDGREYGKSYGPFQIRHLRGRPEPEQLLDPKFNIDYAYGMYVTQGWQPWTCKKVL